MTTLDDDTSEFRVAILNDLLEAEKQGIEPGSVVDVERYRRWAFASTGVAAVLAVLVLVLLVTGGGKRGEGVKVPPNTPRFAFTVSNQLTSDIVRGAKVSVLSGNVVLAGGVIVTDRREDTFGNFKKVILEIAVNQEQLAKLTQAQADKKPLAVQGGPLPESGTSPPPAAPQGTPPNSEPAPAPSTPSS